METYREQVLWPGWVYILVYTCAGVLAFVAGSMLEKGAFIEALAPGIVFIATLVISWRMRKIVLECGPEGAAFGFGGLRRRVPAARIEAAEPETYSMARYMGWGYRFGWKPRDRAYSVIGCRRGVRLVFDDERGRRWDVFVASRDPEAAVAALKP